MVGVLNFANLLPVLLFSLVGGAVSDRLDRRRLVVVASCSSAVVGGSLAVVAALGNVTPGHLVVASVFLGTGYAFAKPAFSAMLPALVSRDRLAHATAINTLQFTFGQVAGSTLSTLILAVAAPWVAFAVNATTFLGPITAMLMLRSVVTQERTHAGPGLAAIREGFRFIFGASGLASVVAAIVLTNGVVEGIRTLAPVLSERALGLAADDAGWIVAAVGVGAAVGASMFGRVQIHLGRRGLVVVGFLLQILGGVIVSTSTGLTGGVFGASLTGLGFSAVIPLLSAVMQERAPDELRGRVMSVFAMAHLGMRPFISILAGTLAATLGVRWAVVVFLAPGFMALALLGSGRRLAATHPEEAMRRASDPES